MNKKLLKSNYFVKIYNLFIRGSIILAKFLLVFFLAKKISIEELGIYSLFITTITVLIFILGLDYYAPNTRNIIAAKNLSDKKLKITNQFFLHLLIYLISIPFLLVLFKLNIIPEKYCLYFYSLLFLEFLLKEIYRLIITLGSPVFATFISFIKDALWVYLLFIVILIYPIQLTLIYIFLIWVVFEVFALGFSVIWLSKKINIFENVKIDTTDIKRTISKASIFLFGTISLKIVEFSNRYFINFFLDKEAVGIFSFYSNISNVIITVTNTMVFFFFLPVLIETFSENIESYKKQYKKMTIETIGVCLFSIIFIILVIKPILSFLDKREFIENIHTLYILIVATVINCFGMLPHYSLYVRHKDKEILYITIISAIVNLVSNYFFIRTWGINGIAYSSILSFSTLLVGKILFVILPGKGKMKCG